MNIKKRNRKKEKYGEYEGKRILSIWSNGTNMGVKKFNG